MKHGAEDLVGGWYLVAAGKKRKREDGESGSWGLSGISCEGRDG